MEAIAPQVVQAYTTRVDLSLDRLPEETYQNLLTRAEAMTRAAAQRSFDQDILVTDVSIIVSVQNQGTIVPVMALEVTRPQWRNNPEPRRWATYFRTARALLFFSKPAQITNSGTKKQPQVVEPSATQTDPLTAIPIPPQSQSQTAQPPASPSQSVLPVPTPPPQTR
jgi:hypothetical protein